MQFKQITNFPPMLFVSIGLFLPCLTLAEGVENNEIYSLCDAGDLVFFTCTTVNKKIISLCGKGLKNNPTGIYYRFGRKDNVEMDFPKDKDKSSFQKFSKDYYFRYRVNLTTISFKNNGYCYSIYDNYIGDDPEIEDKFERGVVVTAKGAIKNIADIKCSSNYGADLSVINKLSDYVE